MYLRTFIYKKVNFINFLVLQMIAKVAKILLVSSVCFQALLLASDSFTISEFEETLKHEK